MKNIGCVLLFAVVVVALGFGLNSLHHEKLEKDEKIRIEEIRIDKQAKIADSISIAKQILLQNACFFCKKQIADKSYNIENDGTFKEYTNINGSHAMFCSIKCCEAYLAKDEAEYNKTHTDDDGSNAYSNPVLDRADEDSNPNRTTCPQCNGSGYESGGIVNGEKQEIICRMCHGSGKGHY
jgi:hypothetical protein